DTRSGALQHRIDVCGASAVRFAARRGIAIVAIERREVVVVDLRFGRILATQAIETPDLDALDLDALLRAPVAEPVVEHVVAAPVSAPPPPPPVEAEPEVDAPDELPAIPALPPRVVAVAPHAPNDRELFDTARELAAALCAHAIARAWDEGRAV